MESRVRHLEAVLASLMAGSEEAAFNELKRLRNEAFADSDEVSKEPQEAHMPTEDVQQLWDPGVDYDSSPYPPILDPALLSNLDIYHIGNLPREHDVVTSINAFHQAPGELFPVMSRGESKKLMNACYNVESRPIQEAELCLLCSIAALGSHFVPDDVLGSVKKSLARSASMLFHESWNLDLVTGLRVMLCQAIFLFMEKQGAFRVALTSGLSVARWCFINDPRTIPETSESIRIVFRSFMFLDAYASMHLDYPSETSLEELKLATTPLNANRGEKPDYNDQFTFLIGNLAKESRQVLIDLDGPNMSSIAMINQRLQSFYIWKKALPDDFLMQSITDEGTLKRKWDDGLWLKVIFLHETYVSVVVLLTRHLMPDILNNRLAGRGWPSEIDTEAAKNCYEAAMEACRACIRFYVLPKYSKDSLYQQNWVLLCDVFVLLCLLLADATVSFTLSSADIEKDLDQLEQAIALMSRQKCHEQLRDSLLSVAKPLLGELEVSYKLSSGASSAILNKEKKTRIAEQAIFVLRSSIGRRSKQTLANMALPVDNMPDWWI